MAILSRLLSNLLLLTTPSDPIQNCSFQHKKKTKTKTKTKHKTKQNKTKQNKTKQNKQTNKQTKKQIPELDYLKYVQILWYFYT